MAILIMMYVYFDEKGDIKTISPDSVTISENYSVATFPLSDVEDFLTGKKNPFDYYVEVVKGPLGTSSKIRRKQVQEVNYTRTLDNFLTEVKTLPRSTDAIVLIENIVKDHKIKISLNSIVKVVFNEGADAEQEIISSFVNTPTAILFFTKKGDPYFLLHTLTFFPLELFEKNELFWDYDVDLSNSSVYTKKIIDGYSYRIKQ